MKVHSSYPFYKSIRFRFGLLFNFLLLIFLLAVILLLYGNVKTELEKNFVLRLSTGITTVMQKTEISPLTIPIPQSNEYFSISYNNTQNTVVLFNNLLSKYLGKPEDSVYKNSDWWSIKKSKSLETGGLLTIVYALPAKDHYDALRQLQILLWIYIPSAILISFISSYLLSGIFLKPLKNIITKANKTDLTTDIKLLEEPVVKDELHELVDALNRMLLRIEKQSQEQNAFFASASHELRTPLSIMLTELQTAHLKNPPEQIQSLIQNQLAEVQRLKKLVNNFLLMSQLKAESVSVNKSEFNIAELCLDKIETLQKSATASLHKFKIDIDPAEADVLVTADKNHIDIIIHNIITNALKYSPEKTLIKIKIKSINGGLTVSFINETVLKIKDISYLKRQFKRADLHTDGFGLGLWIADKLMMLNEGYLSLSSNDNEFEAVICFHCKDYVNEADT